MESHMFHRPIHRNGIMPQNCPRPNYVVVRGALPQRRNLPVERARLRLSLGFVPLQLSTRWPICDNRCLEGNHERRLHWAILQKLRPARAVPERVLCGLEMGREPLRRRGGGQCRGVAYAATAPRRTTPYWKSADARHGRPVHTPGGGDTAGCRRSPSWDGRAWRGPWRCVPGPAVARRRGPPPSSHSSPRRSRTGAAVRL